MQSLGSGMVQAVAVLVPLVVTAALLVGAGVLAVAHDLRSALSAFLDLLLVAGLLKLSADAGWRAIGSAAVVLVVRHLAMWALANARHVASGTPPAPDRHSDR